MATLTPDDELVRLQILADYGEEAAGRFVRVVAPPSSKPELPAVHPYSDHDRRSAPRRATSTKEVGPAPILPRVGEWLILFAIAGIALAIFGWVLSALLGVDMSGVILVGPGDCVLPDGTPVGC